MLDALFSNDRKKEPWKEKFEYDTFFLTKVVIDFA